MKVIGKMEKCMELVKVYGQIKKVTQLQLILENTNKVLNKDLVSIQTVKEQYIKQIGQMDK